MSNSEAKRPVPTSIQKNNDQQMKIVWNTGETTIVPFLNIRFECQCAECVDEWTRQRRIKKEQIRVDIKPNFVDAVGRYAIQIGWNDGHSTGIYPYDLLYSIAKNNTQT